MAVTMTNYGRYRKLVSDATTTDTVISQLAEALSNKSLHGTSVIYFDPDTNKTAVVEAGR